MWRLTKGEKDFQKMMESKGMKLIPQPYLRKFRIRPDFYCVNDDTYYEVISTRSAYLVRAKHIRLSQKRGIRIKVVNPDGTPYERLKIRKRQPREKGTNPSYYIKDFPDNLWNKFRQICKERGVSMRSSIIKLIEDYMKERE